MPKHFEEIERPIDRLKSLLLSTLFELSHIWGFMHYISLSDFLNSVSLSFWLYCISFLCSGLLLYTHCTFLINKDFITYQKKEKMAKKFAVSKWLSRKLWWYIYFVCQFGVKFSYGSFHKNLKFKKKKIRYGSKVLSV